MHLIPPQMYFYAVYEHSEHFRRDQTNSGCYKITQFTYYIILFACHRCSMRRVIPVDSDIKTSILFPELHKGKMGLVAFHSSELLSGCDVT